MNAFEDVVSIIFKRRKYWTQVNYKLVLLPREKKAIGKKSIPTVDIDVVAYRPGEICLIECKSYLGSRGVSHQDLFGKGKGASRYKLFTQGKYGKVLLKALKRDLYQSKMAKKSDDVYLYLVAGKVKGGDDSEERIRADFKKKGWEFVGPQELCDELSDIKEETIWDDNVAYVVTKLLVED